MVHLAGNPIFLLDFPDETCSGKPHQQLLMMSVSARLGCG